jgi:hypothetical protein
VNRAGGRSGSLRNIGRIEQWNVGSGASSPIRCVVSHRLQSADSGPSCRHSRTGRFDLKQTHRRKVIRGNPFSI